ncbi:hypothetical protein IQ255_14975 [Pleurocapsales cyanobacterium LEGE 10410]|nr:hypothetical protein [Pleurocapsales cyanobacterium LEGE 10410]
MKYPRNFNALNSSNGQWKEQLEEELLEEFIKIEDDDPIFSGLADRDTGMRRTLSKLKAIRISGSDVTGGDLDDNWYQAEVVGEEAVGGQTPTPDQNVTEQLLLATGIDAADGELVQVKEKLERRDRQRWELEPDSAEDYEQHS